VSKEHGSEYDIYHITTRHETTLRFLQELNLLKNDVLCDICKSQMNIIEIEGEARNFPYILQEFGPQILQNFIEREREITLTCEKNIKILRGDLQLLDYSSDHLATAGRDYVEKAYNLENIIKIMFDINEEYYRDMYAFFRELDPRIFGEIMY